MDNQALTAKGIGMRNFTPILGAVVACAALAAPRAAHASGAHLFVQFFDPAGKPIAGPVTVIGYAGAAAGLSLLLEWLGEVDPATGHLDRPPRPSRLDLTVPVGPQTPRLAALHAGDEPLAQVVFHFAVAQPGGRLDEFYRVTLRRVLIARHGVRLPDRTDPDLGRRGDQEALRLVYDTLEQEGFDIEQLRYLPGDTNGDLQVDISDTLFMLRHLFLGAAMRCPLSADINNDRELDIADAVAALIFLFAGGEPPPPPFPRCGARPPGALIPCDASACDAAG